MRRLIDYWLPLARLALAAFLSVSAFASAEETLALSTLRADHARLQTLDAEHEIAHRALDRTTLTPLGSVWKLFVYAYLSAKQAPELPYTCTGTRAKEEVYCCGAGQQILRDQALVKSCGLYFAPARLGISAPEWQRFWGVRAAPHWLRTLDQIQPGTNVPVIELLASLQDLPEQARARSVLLDVVLSARDSDVAALLGARFRVKTFSWERNAQRVGGFAGWLSDGTPVHAIARGTSQTVLSKFAPALGRALALGRPAELGGCVAVRWFARYPLRAVRQNGRTMAPGQLLGDYQLEFASGTRLDVQFRGETQLAMVHNEPQLSAKLAIEDYVARVLEREAGPTPQTAAMALAVTIRSYLHQQATPGEGECLHISDSSATQRIAAKPASDAVWRIVAATAGLTLDQPVQYHLSAVKPHTLSWHVAVQQAERGQNYLQILRSAFPLAELTHVGALHQNCEALPAAEAWIAAQIPRWRTRLTPITGFEATPEFRVCRLQGQNPYVDRAAKRIFIRGFASPQDRMDLTHEYVHLAFRNHPSGLDEDFVEQWARKLLGL
jgi:uncharacterized protein YfaQ (DUF2300 family)